MELTILLRVPLNKKQLPLLPRKREQDNFAAVQRHNRRVQLNNKLKTANAAPADPRPLVVSAKPGPDHLQIDPAVKIQKQLPVPQHQRRPKHQNHPTLHQGNFQEGRFA
jgi:hypothetical protein